jgi:hypothetical protein
VCLGAQGGQLRGWRAETDARRRLLWGTRQGGPAGGVGGRSQGYRVRPEGVAWGRAGTSSWASGTRPTGRGPDAKDEAAVRWTPRGATCRHGRALVPDGPNPIRTAPV